MRVLAIAGDAGGARALLPVVQRLQQTDGVSVVSRAYAAASSIWQTEGFPVDAAVPLHLEGVDRIVLGTSVQPEQWELKYLVQAQREGIRTVSVLDHWQHYRERFTDRGALVLPDVIGVMDVRAKTEMIDAGFPEDRLAVTGQPAFEALGADGDPCTSAEARRHLRTTWRIGEHDRVVLYVSQPLSAIDGKEVLGFHEHEVRGEIVAGLGRVLDHRFAGATLLFKPHPREAHEPYQLPPAHSSRLRLLVTEDPCGSAAVLIAGSDLVVGTRSLLLLEACLLRRPVLSYQPGLRIKDSLRSNEWGWSRAVYRQEELERALEEELFDPSACAGLKSFAQLSQASPMPSPSLSS